VLLDIYIEGLILVRVEAIENLFLAQDLSLLVEHFKVLFIQLLHDFTYLLHNFTVKITSNNCGNLPSSPRVQHGA